MKIFRKERAVTISNFSEQHMKDYTSGQLIRFYREREKLTPRELADIIHVSELKVLHWESDETVPKPVMVARLLGALRILDADAPLLRAAVERASLVKQEQRKVARKLLVEQQLEEERLQHKEKALKLLAAGIAGFALALVFAFISGMLEDFSWTGVIVLGLTFAGVPYGWNLLTDKKEHEPEPYRPGTENIIFDFVIKAMYFVLKFIGAFLIGLFVFPIALFYHAFQAGRKGSIYRIVMLMVLIIAVVLVGIGIYLFCISAFRP